MGQAKQKKRLQEVFIQHFGMTPRQFVVDQCKKAHEKYEAEVEAFMMSCNGQFDPTVACEKLKELSALESEISWEALKILVQDGLLTVDEVKNAAWEGYNGLLQAECVAMNLREMLGMKKVPVDYRKFIITR